MRSQLIRLLSERAGDAGPKILRAMAVEGLSNALIIMILNSAAENLDQEGMNLRYFILFVGCVAIFLISKRYVGEQTAIVAHDAVHGIRLRISGKILRSKLAVIEKIDRSRLTTALTEESEKIIQGAVELAKAIPAAVMLLGSFAYIAFLSLMAFWLCLGGLALGIFLIVVKTRRNVPVIQESMARENEFFSLIYQILDGFKELKMNRKKRQDLVDNFLVSSGEVYKSLRIESENNSVKISLVANFVLMTILAANVFILPQITELEPDLIITIMTVLIFIVGNASIVGDAAPYVTRGDLALNSIQQLEEMLDLGGNSEHQPTSKASVVAPFESIELRNLVFEYPRVAASQGFGVGPIDLTIHPGEILFLTGGNGSGKSTLLNLLAGLYYPKAGTIKLDGKALPMSGYPDYREMFSIIPADFHLFDRLYGLSEDEIDRERLAHDLERLELAHLTQYADGKFTNTKLSTGQRKRLALIIALIEDRPICIFDEVAADQDPQSRRYFYRELLPELRAEGRAIIAATHDDAYFDAADRVLKMEYGKLV